MVGLVKPLVITWTHLLVVQMVDIYRMMYRGPPI